MRIAVYHNNHDIRLENIPVPRIGPGEILLKIRATAICGSDVMEWYRSATAPRVLGHEVAGEIAEIGPGVKEYQKGDRITASHHVPCYECHYCNLGHHTLCDTLRKSNFDPGGFAEFVRIPEINCRYGIYKLPKDVSFDEATLIEPLACVIRAQNKISVRAGQSILVIGCGTSGLLHIMLAKARGVHRIIACDLVNFRLNMAQRLGAEQVLPVEKDLPQRLSEVNEGRLTDVVIVCADSKAATQQAFECVGRGGSIVFFALQNPDQIIPLSMNELFWKKGITITSSYAASPEDHRESLRLIASDKLRVKDLITHRLGLSQISSGFDLMTRATESVKVILDPTL